MLLFQYGRQVSRQKLNDHFFLWNDLDFYLLMHFPYFSTYKEGNCVYSKSRDFEVWGRKVKSGFKSITQKRVEQFFRMLLKFVTLTPFYSAILATLVAFVNFGFKIIFESFKPDFLEKFK